MRFQRSDFIAVLAVVLVAGIDGLVGYYRAHPNIDVPAENRTRFVNAIAAVDGTRSMSDANFAAAKEIVARRIVPSIGIGDRLTCLAIGPHYGISNVVFGATFEEQPPQLSSQTARRIADALSRLRSHPKEASASEEFREAFPLVQPLFQQLPAAQSYWDNKLSNMKRPPEDGTAIRALIEGVQAGFDTDAGTPAERWIFLITDLLEQPPVGARAAARSANADALRGVKVVLIYPFESQHDYDSITNAWRAYFGDIEVKIYPFSKVRTQAYVLPPNPLSGFASYHIYTAWDYIRPLLGPELVAFSLLGIFLLSMKLVAARVAQRERATP